MGIYRVFMAINLETIYIDHQLLKCIADIDAFKGKWPFFKEQIEHQLGQIKHISTIESIGSSTRIEGVQMSDKEIVLFIDQLKEDSFLTRDQQEVLGYKHVLDLVFDHFQDIEISENAIKQLHKHLLEHSLKDDFHLGEYKKLDNHVVAKRYDQVIGTIFKTSSPFNTPFDMEGLVKWYQKTTELHSLIKCAVFIVHFLAIHPFQDGNGRLSRALTTLIMLKEGYLYAPYCSLESIIEKNKTAYYKALRHTQRSLSKKPDYSVWFQFFFECLKKQKDLLIEKESLLKPQLSKNQTRLLGFAQTVSSFQNAEAALALTMNKNTVKLNLKKLVDAKLLIKEGTGKGTWYRLNPFQ